MVRNPGSRTVGVATLSSGNRQDQENPPGRPCPGTGYLFNNQFLEQSSKKHRVMSQNIWQRCIQHLEREYPAEEINTWILPLQPVFDQSRTRLLAPNDYVREHISIHYLERIRDIFEHMGAPRESAVVEVGQAERLGGGSTLEPGLEPEPTKTGIDTRYRFDNFVRGASNELAFAAAQQIAQRPGTVYNPLVLYGGTCLGKNHLLLAA